MAKEKDMDPHARRHAAENARLDQRLFLLGDVDHEEFLRRVDAPTEPKAALKRLMATPAPWER